MAEQDRVPVGDIWWIYSDRPDVWAGLRIAHFSKDGERFFILGDSSLVRLWSEAAVDGWRKIEQIPMPQSLAPREYPPGYEPGSDSLGSAYNEQAWNVVDRLPNGALHQAIRYFLAGLIAAKIEVCVDDVLAGKPKPKPGKDRPK